MRGRVAASGTNGTLEDKSSRDDNEQQAIVVTSDPSQPLHQHVELDNDDDHIIIVHENPLRRFYRTHCVYLPAMLGWFVFSSLLSTYNKIVFGEKQWHFPCPLSMTSMHFLVQWVFAYTISSIPRWKESLGGNQVANMPWGQFWRVSIPCGLVTALDVGLSNMAIARISLTFYTMIKASAPIFVLTSAFLFKLEQPSFGLVLVVLIIAAGEFLTVQGEHKSNDDKDEKSIEVVGALLCLGASICAGIRWTVVQFYLQRLDPPLKTAIATMRLVSPCMFIFMLGFGLALEEPWVKLANWNGTPFHILAMALTGGVLAICMISCELWLIMRSSAIVLMIGGVIKELCTICLGVVFFKDVLNLMNVCGFVVVFMGVVLYKIQFHLRSLQQKHSALAQTDEDDSDRNGNLDFDYNEPDGSYGKQIMDEAKELFEGNFTIDDDDEEEDDEDEGKALERNGQGPSKQIV